MTSNSSFIEHSDVMKLEGASLKSAWRRPPPTTLRSFEAGYWAEGALELFQSASPPRTASGVRGLCYTTDRTLYRKSGFVCFAFMGRCLLPTTFKAHQLTPKLPCRCPVLFDGAIVFSRFFILCYNILTNNNIFWIQYVNVN